MRGGGGDMGALMTNIVVFGSHYLTPTSRLETQKLKKMGKKKNKRSRDSSSSTSTSTSTSALHPSNTHTIFPTMLASLSNLHTPFAQSLLETHITYIHKSLTTLTTHTSLFSLLPALLTTTLSPSIALKTAELLGEFALLSMEANESLAADVAVLEALLVVVVRRRRRRRRWRKNGVAVAVAGCNTVLDMCTTEFGRRRLCEVGAVHKLMSVFLQDVDSTASSISLCRMEKGRIKNPRQRTHKNELPVLCFEVTVILINTCSVSQLKKIPRELLKLFLSYLNELWVQVRDQSSRRNIENCNKERNDILYRVKKHTLAESIFRLSINSSSFTTTCIDEVVKRSIFGPSQSDYESFISKHWEDSPFILRSALKPLNDENHIFNLLFQSFDSETTPDAILSSVLGGLVSCPPLPSDELDILNFLKELKDGLGHPIVYGQDIRVVKTVETVHGDKQENLKREVHLLKECTGSSSVPDFFDIGDVEKCKIAYHEGYTIALRGLEFRSEKIASVADGLATLFGQPSVGANAYLTPPGSQGLARHYDDHCVFVCQLRGRKHWTVFPRCNSHLPRLYEPLANLLGLEGDIAASKRTQFLLEEGDILYIPRGCPHEACTTTDTGESQMNGASTGFSFHLTLGIEVEPPFEWEGFAHVALHYWNHKKNQLPMHNPFSVKLNFISINLLHVAIQQIGSLDPTCAKACMVAVFFPNSATRDVQQNDVLGQNRRTTFSCIINKIDTQASFLEVYKSIEVALEENNEDIFQRMRWMRHLYPEGNTKEGLDWDNPFTEFENLFQLCNEHKDEVEATFMKVKSKFCNEVIYEDVCESFEKLLHKYRRARTEYMNGMLSLHCTSSII